MREVLNKLINFDIAIVENAILISFCVFYAVSGNVLVKRSKLGEIFRCANQIVPSKLFITIKSAFILEHSFELTVFHYIV